MKYHAPPPIFREYVKQWNGKKEKTGKNEVINRYTSIPPTQPLQITTWGRDPGLFGGVCPPSFQKQCHVPASTVIAEIKEMSRTLFSNIPRTSPIKYQILNIISGIPISSWSWVINYKLCIFHKQTEMRRVSVIYSAVFDFQQLHAAVPRHPQQIMSPAPKLSVRMLEGKFSIVLCLVVAPFIRLNISSGCQLYINCIEGE